MYRENKLPSILYENITSFHLIIVFVLYNIIRGTYAHTVSRLLIYNTAIR